MWAFPGTKAPEVGATWWYNWKPSQGGGNAPGFVPMIWGERDNLTLVFKALKGPGTLLGFNEPDNCGRGGTCLSVQRAIQSWPRLEGTGRRLGSPAVAWDYTWLDKFLAAGCHVDFLALHHYELSLEDPEQAAVRTVAFLAEKHQRYNLPIWFTEFGALWDNNQDRISRYIRALVPKLEQLPYLERYAWFSDHAYGSAWASALWDNQGSLTETGRVYACPSCEH